MGRAETADCIFPFRKRYEVDPIMTIRTTPVLLRIGRSMHWVSCSACISNDRDRWVQTRQGYMLENFKSIAAVAAECSELIAVVVIIICPGASCTSKEPERHF